LGDVRAARAVAAWILEHPDATNAHRVVRADGRPIFTKARSRLRSEGVRLPRGRATSESVVESVAGQRILEELRTEQGRLASKVSMEDEAMPPQSIGGVDVAYEGDRAYAVAVRFDTRRLELEEIAQTVVDVDFPYIPTYLAYREFPAVRAAVERLRQRPDVLLVDGHGRLHPARFGFACFVGVRLDLPTIGVAKHALLGRTVPSSEAPGGAIPVEVDGRVEGYAWVPPGRERPLYVSVGHRVSLERALDIVRQVTKRGYPEPLAVADRLSKRMKIREKGKRSASE